MPCVDWRAEQIACLPIDALLCVIARAYLGVAVAENHIEKCLACVAMSGRRASWWYLAYMSLEILDIGENKIRRRISTVCTRMN